MIIKNIIFWILTLAWMGVIFVLSSQPDLRSSLDPIYDYIFRKAAHFMEYFILALLLTQALDGRRWRWRSAFIIAFLYASSDEWHQSFVRGRVAYSGDVLIDSLGALTAVMLLKNHPWSRDKG